MKKREVGDGERPKNQISHRKQLSSLAVKENIALVKLCKCQEQLKKPIDQFTSISLVP